MFVVSCCKPLLPLLSCVFVLSFVKSVFAVGSEAVAVFDIIFKKFIGCRGCFRGWLIGLLFLVVLGWMIVCCYCISWQILWLTDMIVYCGWLYVVIVCVIDFTIGEIVCRVCFDGLFAVVVFVIDFTFDWWDSFSCLFVMVCFGRVFDWEILDCFFWLFVVIVWCNFVLVFYWTVVFW